MCFIDLLIIFLKSGEGYSMGACIQKRVLYDMSCKRFQCFVNMEALVMTP